MLRPRRLCFLSLISDVINNPTLTLQGIVHPCLGGRALLGVHAHPATGRQTCLHHQVYSVQPQGSLQVTHFDSGMWLGTYGVTLDKPLAFSSLPSK